MYFRNHFSFPHKLAVVDLETTGLNPKIDRIVEIAILCVNQIGEVESSFSTLVRAENDLGQGVVGPTHIHQIELLDCAFAPTFAEIFREVYGILDGRIIVGHNVSFDINFLTAEFQRLGITRTPDFLHSSICTLEQGQQILPVGSRSIKNMAFRAGVTISPDHSAITDAKVTYELLCSLVQRNPDLQFPKPLRIYLPPRIPNENSNLKYLITRKKRLRVAKYLQNLYHPNNSYDLELIQKLIVVLLGYEFPKNEKFSDKSSSTKGNSPEDDLPTEPYCRSNTNTSQIDLFRSQDSGKEDPRIRTKDIQSTTNSVAGISSVEPEGKAWKHVDASILEAKTLLAWIQERIPLVDLLGLSRILGLDRP